MNLFRENIDLGRDIYSKRKLYNRLIKAHFFGLYSGSRVGLYWMILGPLILLALYSITYGVVYKFVLPDYSVLQYITSVYAGLILLLSFLNLLSISTSALRTNFRLRLFGLEVESIPTKIVITEGIPFAIGLLLLSILSVICTGKFIHLFFFPLFLILYFYFLIGIARFMTVFSALFKDVEYIIPYLGIIFLIITPISYIPSMIPSGVKILYTFNPLYYFCVFLQKLAINGYFDFKFFIVIIIISSFSPILGKMFFKKTLPLVRDSLVQ